VRNLGGNSQVTVRRLGTTGGDSVLLPKQRPLPVARLKQQFEAWLPDYMAGKA
jgi:phosphoribosylformylglycinamidine synthase